MPNRSTTLIAAFALASLTACAGPGQATLEPEPTASLAPATADGGTPDPGTADPGTTPGASRSATADPAARPSSEGGFDDPAECRNEELAYEVEYPADWWANERVEPEDENLTPIPACVFFAPSEVELQPNAGLPNGIAIQLDVPSQRIDPPEDEILHEEERTVDDRVARVIETEPAPQLGFVPEGSRIYRYIVQLDDGRQLVASTDNILQDDAAYQQSKNVLDAMMESLELDG